MKNNTFATDKKPYNTLKDNPDTKQLAKIYNNLSTGRMDKYAIAQLIKNGTYSLNFDAAIMHSFRRTKSQPNTSNNPKFTKKELKTAKLAYSISQADLGHLIITTLLWNDKLANSLKLLSQIKQYINDNNTEANNVAASLNISLTNKTSKTPTKTKDKKQDTNTNTKKSESSTATPDEPLQLHLVNDKK